MISFRIPKPEGVGVRRPRPSGPSSFTPITSLDLPPRFLSGTTLFKRPDTLLEPFQATLPGAPPVPAAPSPLPQKGRVWPPGPYFSHDSATAIPSGMTGSPDNTHLMLGVGVAEDTGAKPLRPPRTADRSVSSQSPAHTGSSLRSAGSVVTHELRMHRPGPITAHCWATWPHPLGGASISAYSRLSRRLGSDWQEGHPLAWRS